MQPLGKRILSAFPKGLRCELTSRPKPDWPSSVPFIFLNWTVETELLCSGTRIRLSFGPRRGRLFSAAAGFCYGTTRGESPSKDQIDQNQAVPVSLFALEF